MYIYIYAYTYTYIHIQAASEQRGMVPSIAKALPPPRAATLNI